MAGHSLHGSFAPWASSVEDSRFLQQLFEGEHFSPEHSPGITPLSSEELHSWPTAGLPVLADFISLNLAH